MSIVWIILIGFVVGLLAKMLTPGRDPAGFFITAAIGIAGSLLATYGGQALGLYRAGEPAGFFGSLNEYSRKVAYFFHASLQGIAAQPDAAEALTLVADAGLVQGLLADGQCFTTVQLARGLKTQSNGLNLDKLLPPDLRALSCEVKARKPSETIFRKALLALLGKGIRPEEILHVGSRLTRDVAPASE